MPDWKALVRERLAPLQLTAAAESDLAEELAQHLEDHYRELRGGGAAHDTAWQLTLEELSDVYRMQADARSQRLPRYDAVPAGDLRPARILEGLWRDLRYATRTMQKSPLFVLVVVVTLALGIGANTTVFTLINTLILNPLPVADPSRLVAIAAADAGKSNNPLPISYADLKDYQRWNGVFGSLAGYTSPRGVTWQQNGGGTHGLFVELATTGYFSTLGLAPVKGRYFAADDGSLGSPPVAVINYAAWQTHFGGSNGIIGTNLRINNTIVTIIGVAPPNFIGLNSIFGPDLWLPAATADRLFPAAMQNALTDRTKPFFQGVGRLKPGVTRAQVQANLSNIAADLARQYPAANENHTISVFSLRDALNARTGTDPTQLVIGSVALLAVVFVVLLIACSNVANLLLARSAARQQEMAVRVAMGASRRRLMRQLLTESVLLGLLGGCMGVGVGYGGLKLVFGTLPQAANFVEPKLDGWVLLFAFGISLVTGFLFGAIPAFKASGANVAEELKDGGRTAGRSRGKVTLANGLLVGQVALSFLLLMLAALFLRSIQRAYAIDPGFQTARLATLPTSPGQAGYAPPQVAAFYDDVRARVSAMPGVDSAAWASNMPLWARPVPGLQIEGRSQRSRSDTLNTIVNTVDWAYFTTAGVPIDSGRDFTELDRDTSPPVAIVNEKMAHDYWPTGALGKRLQLPGEKQMRQIVGVARTSNYTGWGESPQSCVYVPMRQSYSDSMILYVRTKKDPADIFVPVEREIHAAGPQVMIFSVRTGNQIVDGGLFSAKIGVALLTVFGLLALALASIGLYGILAYSVNQRKREIGVRMALGATRSSVLAMVLRQGMTLVVTGVLLGFGGALLVGRLLSRMLYGVSADDPLSIAGAAVMLCLVALLACYLPARRATRVDPLQALHEA